MVTEPELDSLSQILVPPNRTIFNLRSAFVLLQVIVILDIVTSVPEPLVIVQVGKAMSSLIAPLWLNVQENGEVTVKDMLSAFEVTDPLEALPVAVFVSVPTSPDWIV